MTLPATNVPLWAPFYNAPIGVAVTRFWSKYLVFNGRASRAEYWWWALVAVVVGLVLQLVGLAFGLTPGTGLGQNDVAGAAPLSPGALVVSGVILVWGLATLIPSLSLTVRRLHDVNRSGYYILLGLIPLVGGIILLVFVLLPPNASGQRFDRPTP